MSPRPVALVTGGSRGIGRGICQALATHYAVAVNYAGNVEAARETVASLGPGAEAEVFQADVGSPEDRERLITAILARWGRIDVLINNAGITSVGRKDILEATRESWQQVLAVNLEAPFFLTQRVAQWMRDHPDSIRRSIVNISSVSAYAISVNRGDYCISKAGLGMATQLWATRLAEYGISVYEVRPGIIETDMTAAARDKYTPLIADGLTPIRRWGTPEDVGRAVSALVLGEIPFSTGEVVNVDGGFHLRRFPS